MTREPNSPEAQAFFLAEMEDIRRSAEEGAQLREAALAAEHARFKTSAAGVTAASRTQGVAMPSAELGSAAVVTLPQKTVPPLAREKRAGRDASTDADYHKHKLKTLWLRYLRTKTKEGITGRAEGTY